MLGLVKKDIYILRRYNYRPGQKAVILLLITDEENKHHPAFKSFSR